MDELQQFFEEYEKDLPEPDRLVRQAHRAHLSGELENAVELFSQAIAKGRNDPGVRLDLARVLLEIGRPQEAVDALESALKDSEDHIVARSIHLAMSQAYEALGDDEGRRRHYMAYQGAIADL